MERSRAGDGPGDPFHPSGPPRLGDGRVALRPVRDDDVADLVEISYYDGVAARDEGEALAMLRRVRHDTAKRESLHWAIVVPPEGDRVAGTCGLYRGFDGGVGEIGYVLRPECRGRGLMSAAVRLVVTFAFERLGLRRVVAYTARDNEASVAVLLRTGFAEVATADGGRTFERVRQPR